MADSYLEDITSEAEEEMAGMTTEEAADKEVDGEAEEEEQEMTELRPKKNRFPRTSMGTGQNAMSRTLTSKLWRTRAQWPPRQSPTRGLTSKPRCQPLTPPKS
jgi:hypothetical protein